MTAATADALTTAAGDPPGTDAELAGPSGPTGAEVPSSGRRPFTVSLDNFTGPFDLLLQLISQRRLDVTEVALHQVTDDFIAHLRPLDGAWGAADLDQVTEFLVVAATLLDLKAARLLPQPEGQEDDGGELLEAKDLLFARLLAYRAYQQVAVLFTELEATALRRYPRAVTLEQRYLGLLPEVSIGQDPEGFAALATRVFTPKPPPTVNLDHIHSSPVSVAEHTAAVRAILTERGHAEFGELVAGCDEVLEVVARFLGLLHLYREALVGFDQGEPMGRLMVHWTGGATSAGSPDRPVGDEPGTGPSGAATAAATTGVPGIDETEFDEYG
ncbi:segregation and condensation protein A [Nakamurella leprariae]|uniref:Segregation and condensation protein A n=1 Tax=Nakamurella leprariae TaxID=2803911 RepID=A0A939C1A9_9ACTN|nr:segregation/condensation protein A [Nakamurella leprariae]MBM9469616.1 segregation/condensation protein A [Nakamurella leprariae]